MKGNGKQINFMEKVFLFQKMEIIMRVIGKMTLDKVKENIFGTLKIIMMEIGPIIKEQAKVLHI